MKNINFTKGYSLIELVIYIGLFVLVSVVVVQSLLYSMKTYSNARAYRTLQGNAVTSLDRVTREIRQASSVSDGSSVFGSSPGTLVLAGEDSGGSPYTATISAPSGIVQIVIGGVTTPLTSTEVTVSNLVFWHITTSSSDAIKLQMSLTTARAPYITKDFYTTVVVRE